MLPKFALEVKNVLFDVLLVFSAYAEFRLPVINPVADSIPVDGTKLRALVVVAA